ncbi:alpha/beta hydrolase [Reichenbachiella sp. MALMAid0571]|uniref:alpha/beta hydrolase n=1 Tax=Reichenbachiella sp. MALMAid0571 TaxID=3143939 RepID=UPI0032DF7227
MKFKVIILNFAWLIFLFSCSKKTTDPNRTLEAPSGYMNETFLKISYALGMLDLIEAKPAVPDDILEIKNIEYKKIDTISLQLDIYKAKKQQEPAPVMIFIHGGAWKSGKRSDYLSYLIDYARKGYVTVTVSYRLAKVAKFPAAVQDVNCAVQWVRDHAHEYNIDADKMVLIGGSAGGHLSMMAGYAEDEPMFNEGCYAQNSAKVKAVINLYGVADLTTPESKIRKEPLNFIGAKYDEKPEMYKMASPRFFITSDDPPTLTFHGTIDSIVPVSQSDSLDIWLKKAGVPHDYHRLKGWPHTMDLSAKVNEYCQFYIDQFLDKHL